jgi:hypothetical protein
MIGADALCDARCGSKADAKQHVPLVKRRGRWTGSAPRISLTLDPGYK